MLTSMAVPAGDAVRRDAPGDSARPRFVPLALVLTLGAAARIVAYAANRSIWTDEAALAASIVHRSFRQLAAPLEFAQVAPLGFLWLEKGVVSLFGASEWALRLVPFLAALASLVLFVLVARRVLDDGGALFATTLFAVAAPLIYFATETKQYSSDMAVALALVLLALRLRERPLDAPRAAALGVAGALAPFLSQPSLFVLAGVGTVLLLDAARGAGDGRARRLAPVLLAWAVGSAIAILQAMRAVSPVDRRYLEGYWSGAFLPLDHGLLASLRWLWRFAADLAAWLFPAPWGWLVLACVAVGIIALVRRRDGVLSLLLAPLVIALLASAPRLYPMSARVSLFIVPAILLTAGAGAGWLLRATASMGVARGAVALVLAVTALACVASVRYASLTREELRPVMRWVAAHRRGGDIVYVYYGAARAFDFYAPRLGFAPGSYQVGRCSRADWRGYVADLDSLKGHDRVWLVLAHPFHKAGIREDSLVLGYLDRVGHLRASTSAPGALARLYDLSDGARAASTLPPFTPPASGDTSGLRDGCWGAVGPR